jgi:8-oxo-dGTP diphosphatase
MPEAKDLIKEAYGNKLRIRVCGICIEDGQLLLVKHDHLGRTGTLWAPPGGGMEYGESAEEALLREFKEETNLSVEIINFLFVHEYLDPPLHGIELFFQVKINEGTLSLGQDPEMPTTNQILSDAKFVDLKMLQNRDMASLHYVLQHVKDLQALINQKGYFKFH